VYLYKVNEKYINPYFEHGKKKEQAKRIAVSIPYKLLSIITKEKNRRKIKNLKHATIGELLCEAFLHSYTGQALPSDQDLVKKKK
jgi:MetJ family methionine regulon transcriptional repressor